MAHPDDSEKRDHRTTIRWTRSELLTISAKMPAGMTLASFIRRSTLDGVNERRPDHADLPGQLGPVRDRDPL